MTNKPPATAIATMDFVPIPESSPASPVVEGAAELDVPVGVPVTVWMMVIKPPCSSVVVTGLVVIIGAGV